MPRLLWPVALVVAFGIGLAAGGFAWQRSSPSGDPEALQATVKRLELQNSTLQARLRARETSPAGSQTQMSAAAERETWPDRSVAGLALDEQRSRRGPRGGAPQGEPQDDLASSAGGSRRATAPVPTTVEAALERFYRSLEDMTAPGGPGRRGWRELIDDFRAMGSTGADALMRVLTSGTTSDERRAAAQLLGALQIPQALPLFQDILHKEGDLLLRRAAASGLRRLQTPETIPVMETILANPGEDRFVRLSAAHGLAQQGRTQGITGLTQIFDEANLDGRGRELAFRALASLDDARSLPFMRRLVTSSEEVGYRLQAIRFLTAHGDRQALVSLQQVSQSPTEQPSIRDAARLAYTTIATR